MNTTTPTSTLPFELGEARSVGGLAVIPLYAASAPHVEYVGLDAGQFDEAEQLVAGTATRLRAFGLAGEAADLELDLPGLTATTYSPAARKGMHCKSHRRHRGKQI
jgi:hypothetical protein